MEDFNQDESRTMRTPLLPLLPRELEAAQIDFPDDIGMSGQIGISYTNKCPYSKVQAHGTSTFCRSVYITNRTSTDR